MKKNSRVSTKLSYKIGEQFGKLTVLERMENSGPQKSRSMWKFKCECGVVPACPDCRRIEVINKSPLSDTLERQMYTQHILSARSRRIKFDIGREEFGIITSLSCFYCHRPPHRKYRGSVSPSERQREGFILVGGIDRVDNSRGYHSDNIVPCCSRCNTMKLNMHVMEFIDHVELIYKAQTGKS